MAIATKSVSSFTILFVLFLVISEVPEIKAQDKKCLKEYGGEEGFGLCALQIVPSLCYQKCRENKGAKGGKCSWEEGINVKCLCDYCSDEPNDEILSGGI